MRIVISVYCLCFSVFFAFSQDWKKELNAARKLYKEGKYDESLKKYKSVRKIVPKNLDLSDEIAQSSYRANKFDDAEKTYSKSSSSKGNSLQKSKTYHNIGNTKLKQKKYDEAIEAYKESLRNNPSDDETRYNLSEAMKRQKQENNPNEKPKNKPNQSNSPQKNNTPPQNNTPKNKQGNTPPKNEEGNQQSQFSNNKTERMLDDLVKKEMDTKKKMGGNKNKSSKNKTGKDW